MQIIKKYMRIQGHEYSYGTGKPTGVFSLCIRRVDNGILPYDIVFTDHAGKIIYEDEYQVGVIDE